MKNFKLDGSIIRNSKEIANILSTERTKQKYSQQFVADNLACGRSTISNIENGGYASNKKRKAKGEYAPNPDIVIRYAAFLGLDLFENIFTPEFCAVYREEFITDRNIQDRISKFTAQQKVHLLKLLDDFALVVNSEDA